MNKNTIIMKAFYLLAIINFIIYLINHKSYSMFIGGIFLIVGSVMMIFENKKSNKK